MFPLVKTWRLAFLKIDKIDLLISHKDKIISNLKG